jgi:hypothetical protein
LVSWRLSYFPPGVSMSFVTICITRGLHVCCWSLPRHVNHSSFCLVTLACLMCLLKLSLEGCGSSQQFITKCHDKALLLWTHFRDFSVFFRMFRSLIYYTNVQFICFILSRILEYGFR